MSGSAIVVVGASAGGVDGLRRFVGGLPPDLPASVAIVLHISPTSRSLLPQVLSRATRLPVAHAVDGEEPQDGHIYVAPPDLHLVVDERAFRLTHGPTENGTRPAIDPLFRSAARSYGQRAVGVVLSGSLDDGTGGLFDIKRHGGVTMVQDPADASYPDMPLSAIEHVEVDVIAPADELPKHVAAAVRIRHRVARRAPKPPAPGLEDVDTSSSSVLTCPDCNGPLREVHDGPYRYRCRVGHEWTEVALAEGQDRALENALWTAVRIIGERVDLAERMQQRAMARGHHHVGQMLAERVANLRDHEDRLRSALDEPAVPTLMPVDFVTGDEADVGTG
jgi:two-component system, chemotaxis family, protein-glutamate methylesterase/glutaminase